MVDHLTSNSKLVKSIKENDNFEAFRIIREKLSKIAERKIGIIVEDENSDNPFLELSMAAKSFGGEDAIQNNGVIAVYFRSRQGAGHFTDYLEDSKYVDTYEINASWENRTTDQDQPVVDLDDITDDRAYNFEVIIYLYPEYIEYTGDPLGLDYDGDTEEDDTDFDNEAYESFKFTPNEPIHEVIRKIRVNSMNVKSVKMKCGRGFKWDPTIHTCVKIGGSDLADMRRGARHAVITKRAEGAAFATRVKRRTLRAFKFRKMAGLRV